MATKTSSKNYTDIAKKNITRPSQRKREMKILVYARNKKGKTTFGISAGVNKTLVIDPEAGTDEMKQSDPHVWHVASWEEMQDVYGFLRSGADCPVCDTPHPLEWIVVDGMTKLHKLALNYVMRVEEERNLDRQPGFVQQRDYGKANEVLRGLLVNFHNLPHGVIYTAQERMLTEGEFSDEDEDVENPAVQFVPDLPKGIRGEMNAIVDVIGRLYTVKIDDKVERRLWIGPSDAFDTGYRSDFGDTIAPMLRKPTVPRLVRLLRTGSATIKRA